MVVTRSFLNVKTQFDNVGDAVIIRELVLLAAERSQVELYLGRAPDSFAQLLADGLPRSVMAHRQGGFASLIARLVRARLRGERCYYFLIPGGLNGEKSFPAMLTGLTGLLVLALLAAIGVRICQTGFSIERLGPRHAAVLRLRSHLMHACAIRDEWSERDALRLGFRITHRIPDLALNLFSRGLPATARSVSRKTTIGFSFRIDKDPAIRFRIDELVDQLCRALPANVDLLFVAQVGRDLPYMKQLAERIGQFCPGRARLLDTHESIDETLAAYASCQAVLSNRLHGLLLGLRAGAMPVALASSALDHKIAGVFATIGLEHRVLDLVKVELEDIQPLLEAEPIDCQVAVDDLGLVFDNIFGID